MKKTKFLLTILSFIVLPNIIYADCTDEEREYFKRIEDDYKITYEYDKDTKDYIMTFYSPEPDKYEYTIYASKDNFANYEEISERETTYYHVPGEEYFIQIKGQTDTCNESLKDITINLTRKNNYVDDPLCEGIEEFVLCQPTYDKEIDYETFVSRVNTYKKTKQKETIPEEPKQENVIISKIKAFLEENLLEIIIGLIFAIAVVITIILTAKSIRKSRRLE